MVADVNTIMRMNQELMCIYKMIQDKQLEIKNTRNQIQKIPGQDEILLEIRMIEKQLEEEENEILLMAVALKRISDLIYKAENSIVQNYEDDIKIRNNNITGNFMIAATARVFDTIRFLR